MFSVIGTKIAEQREFWNNIRRKIYDYEKLMRAFLDKQPGYLKMACLNEKSTPKAGFSIGYHDNQEVTLSELDKVSFSVSDTQNDIL